MDDFTNFGELLIDGKKCCNGYRWKHSVQIFELHILRWTSRNRKRILEYKWKPKTTHNFVINERGKKRDIKAHYIQDRQVYKSYNRLVLKPSFEPLLVESNSASRTGKGTDYAIKQFRQDLAHAFKKYGLDFFVVTYDFHDYFNSINHDVLLQDLLNKIENRPDLFVDYINIFNNGVGIGGEPSQTIAVTYPHKLDRFLLCSPLVLRSGRFMDDGYAICHTKQDAQEILSEIYRYTKDLKLEINHKEAKALWTKKF